MQIINVAVGCLLAHQFNRIQQNPVIIRNPATIAWLRNQVMNPMANLVDI